MKIQQPIKAAESLPERGKNHGRFRDVWTAVRQLHGGEKLPVQCDSKDEVRRLYMAAKTHRTLKLGAATRELTVFIWNVKPTKRNGAARK